MSQALPEHRTSSAAGGRRAFAAWVDEAADGRIFGELVLRRIETGYELRHRKDSNAFIENLDFYENPRAAQEIAKLTAEGEYRPLKSSPNLRCGWVMHLAEDSELLIAMNYFYPAAVAHWYSERNGELPLTSYREAAARQSGIYRIVQNLSDTGVQNAARACCEDTVCLKRILWKVDSDTPLDMEAGMGRIVCPEPCSLFLSFARQVTLLEGEDRNAQGFSLTERQDMSSVLEAAASAELHMAREGEFDNPLNRRRLRYRTLTLLPRIQGKQGTEK